VDSTDDVSGRFQIQAIGSNIYGYGNVGIEESFGANNSAVSEIGAGISGPITSVELVGIFSGSVDSGTLEVFGA